MLDHDQGRGYEGGSSHVGDGVVAHGLDDGHGLAGTGSGAGNAQGQGGAVAYPRDVGLVDKSNELWTLKFKEALWY